MKILISKNREQYERDTRHYRESFEPLVEEFTRGISRIPELREHPVFRYYTATMRWPIRQLEYSYVIGEVTKRNWQRPVTLDVGCGVTPFAFCISRILGAEAIALDSEPDLLRLMKGYQEQLFGQEIQYVSSDLRSVPFPDESFDVVSSISVIEHLQRGTDLDAITELLRTVKTGGMLLLTVDFTSDYRRRASHWLYRIRKLVEHLGRGKFEFIIGRASRIARNVETQTAETGPYSREKIYEAIVPRFKLDAKVDLEPIFLEDIRSFWSRHWFPECGYSRNGRDYVSIGITMLKG